MTKRFLFILFLLVDCFNLHAQGGYGTDYFELEHEFRKVLIEADRQHLKSITVSYRMDEGTSYVKGKIHLTFLNDSVFVLKNHTGKTTYVFRGKSYYRYGQQDPTGLHTLNVIDSANCQVIRGTQFYNSDSNYPVSYCRFAKDSSGRTTDYYYNYGKLVMHETYEYEGDTAYFKNSWRTEGDSLVHISRQYVYEFYSPDSSFYTRTVKTYPFPDDTTRFQGITFESTRTYTSSDQQGRVTEIRKETAEATDGKVPPGLRVHRMKFAYKLR